MKWWQIFALVGWLGPVVVVLGLVLVELARLRRAVDRLVERAGRASEKS